jgi:hypothetical protein
MIGTPTVVNTAPDAALNLASRSVPDHGFEAVSVMPGIHQAVGPRHAGLV